MNGSPPPPGREDPVRVAVVTDIPTPYRDPLWSRFAREPKVDLTVFYTAREEDFLDWTPHWDLPPSREFLPGHTWTLRPRNPVTLKWNPALWRRLDRLRPGAVIVGSWGQPTSWIAITWCRHNGVPYIIQCESHLLDPRPWWVRLAKQGLVRLAVTGQAAGLPTGSLARSCMTHYGATPETLFLFPNSPDAQALADRARELRARRDRLRSSLGYRGRKVILFVGRLIPIKGVDILLEAAALLRARHPDLLLALAGQGGERAALEDRARASDLAGAVRFHGFVQPEAIAELYVGADLFCLPSRFEPWGAVVNEAMACGLPVVLSDRVGAGYDVPDEACSRIVPSDNPGALADALDHFLSIDPTEREDAGTRATERALRWSHPLCLRSLRRALETALGRPSAPGEAPGPPHRRG